MIKLNHSIEENQWIGIIGANGAGKSTFLKCLAGQDQSFNGDVIFNNISLKDQREHFLDLVGYMPDHMCNSSDYSAHQFLQLISLCKAKNVFDDSQLQPLLKSIQSFQQQKLSQCSLGQLQQINLIQCLINHPKLLLLDEPNNGLDPVQKSFFWNTLEQMAKSSMVFISSHHYSELLDRCDKLWIINNGDLCHNINLNATGIIASVNHTKKVQFHSLTDHKNSQQLKTNLEPDSTIIEGTYESVFKQIFDQIAVGEWQW